MAGRSSQDWAYKKRPFYIGGLVLFLLAKITAGNEDYSTCPKQGSSAEDEPDECCVCDGKCPIGYFLLDNIPGQCNETTINGTSRNITSTCMSSVTCGKCDEQCSDSKGCNGSQASDCLAACDCEEKDEPLPVAIIAGATAGGVVFIAIAVVGVCCWCRRKRRRPEEHHRTMESEENKFDATTAEVKKLKSGRKDSPFNHDIREGCDNVLRYTKDPTENIPQKPQLEKDRQSELYENGSHGRLMTKISVEEAAFNAPQSPFPEQLYGNLAFQKQQRELQEIESLPMAPIPKPHKHKQAHISVTAQVSGVKKGPSYTDIHVSSDEEEESETKTARSRGRIKSKLSESSLMKGPSYREFPDDSISEEPEISQAGILKVNKSRGAPKAPQSLWRGPMYTEDSNGEEEFDNAPPLQTPYGEKSLKSGKSKGSKGDVSDPKHKKPSLFKGPMYDPNHDTYKGKQISAPAQASAGPQVGRVKVMASQFTGQGHTHNEGYSTDGSEDAVSVRSYENMPKDASEIISGKKKVPMPSHPIYDNL